MPAAEGYARASGIPFGQGLVKNRYIGRTFIAPSQEMRALGVRMKLNPLRENIAGKRLVVVDDSIVRGTTQKQLVRMLREAGALEVHLRLTSPPFRWPCFYGMDTGDPERAARRQPRRRRDPRLPRRRHARLPRRSTGCSRPPAPPAPASAPPASPASYPVDVPVELRKGVLETGGRLAIDRDSSRVGQRGARGGLAAAGRRGAPPTTPVERRRARRPGRV